MIQVDFFFPYNGNIVFSDGENTNLVATLLHIKRLYESTMSCNLNAVFSNQQEIQREQAAE